MKQLLVTIYFNISRLNITSHYDPQGESATPSAPTTSGNHATAHAREFSRPHEAIASH